MSLGGWFGIDDREIKLCRSRVRYVLLAVHGATHADCMYTRARLTHRGWAGCISFPGMVGAFMVAVRVVVGATVRDSEGAGR